ncbi:PcfJ domain-containing protein [Aerococcaceae bacterium NML160702]|nr:PcfJ domain-containing protein [Aerococcaceae bacterium NML160702]
MTKRPETYIKQKLQPPKAFFDWCYSHFPIYRWRNKHQEIVSGNREGCPVIEKRLTKSTKLDYPDKFHSFAIVLVTPKRIEIQSYGFWHGVLGGRESITSRLINFEQFANDEHVKVTEQYGNLIFGLSVTYSSLGGPYQNTKFYDNDWRTAIKEYSEMRYLKFSEHIDRTHLASFYKYRKEIEFLQKIGANRMAESIMWRPYEVDMRTMTRKWLKENKPFFKNSDRAFSDYELERRIKERNGKVVQGIEKYLSYKDIKHIPKGIGMVRFQNWVIRNEVDFNYYMDYLGLLEDLGIDPTGDENLIIPKDLERAHDNAVQLLNSLEKERLSMADRAQSKRVAKRLAQLRKYEMELQGYVFVAPKGAEDLIREGKALHHCVGGSDYIAKHAKGKTTIIFVRDASKAGKSLYTLEYREGRIVQVRGKHNKSAPADVQSVVDVWLREVNKIKKTKKKVGAL